MKVADLTKDFLAFRRQSRDLTAKGYEVIGERGGRLWELYRGGRVNCRIVDAIVGADGKCVFVKIEPTSRI